MSIKCNNPDWIQLKSCLTTALQKSHYWVYLKPRKQLIPDWAVTEVNNKCLEKQLNQEGKSKNQRKGEKIANSTISWIFKNLYAVIYTPSVRNKPVSFPSCKFTIFNSYLSVKIFPLEFDFFLKVISHFYQ